MLHSFYGQEITEPFAQILRLKLNHYLLYFVVIFKKYIIYACSVCYICTYACVSQGSHVSTCMWTILDIVPPQRNNPLMPCTLHFETVSHQSWAHQLGSGGKRVNHKNIQLSTLRLQIHHYHWHFSWLLGVRLRSSVLQEQSFTDLSNLPNPLLLQKE